MKKSLVMMLLVLASAALVQQSVAQAAGQPERFSIMATLPGLIEQV